ncbi:MULTISPECIES: hypothetical protein [Streptomyces]|uniref:hypothetical protein n=1 Tax=Streptomyces TaxID=1883 RepID=UPI0006894930|nr:MULTISPECIES: hypothetical protein [Streptomyces]
MRDGITWIAKSDINECGYCVTFARGPSSSDLATRLVAAAPEWSRAHLSLHHGTIGDLAYAVAEGDTWSGVMGPGYTEGLSDGGAHVFQLYYESRNPKLPPPDFCYFHDGQLLCGFDMYMHTWSHEVVGTQPELVAPYLHTAGVPEEADRDTAHLKSLQVIQERFGLTLPREEVLRQ